MPVRMTFSGRAIVFSIKPDLYTKAVLTVIPFMLVMIGCHQYVSPATNVKAEGQFANLQLTIDEGGGYYHFFDTRTGEIWEYHLWNSGRSQELGKYKLVQLGQPLIKEIDLSIRLTNGKI